MLQQAIQPISKRIFRLSDTDRKHLREYAKDLSRVTEALFAKFPGVTNNTRVLRFLLQVRVQEIIRLSKKENYDEASRPQITDMDPLVTFTIAYAAITIISSHHPTLRTWSIWNAQNLQELTALDKNFATYFFCWPIMKEAFKGVALPPRRLTLDLKTVLSQIAPHFSVEHFACFHHIGVPEPVYQVVLRRWESADQFEFFNRKMDFVDETDVELRTNHLRAVDTAAVSDDWDAVRELVR
ncbi:MAG: hypothetical protein WA705_00815 [Candidatus Ozemobacteraceae bacterium]